MWFERLQVVAAWGLTDLCLVHFWCHSVALLYQRAEHCTRMSEKNTTKDSKRSKTAAAGEYAGEAPWLTDSENSAIVHPPAEEYLHDKAKLTQEEGNNDASFAALVPDSTPSAGRRLLKPSASTGRRTVDDAEEAPPRLPSRDVYSFAIRSGSPGLPAHHHSSRGTKQDAAEDTSSRSSGNRSDIIECELTEDVYSLVYTASYASPAFSFAIFVFLFQMTIVALVLWDLLDHSNRGSNPLNVPPGNSPQVQAAMALALLLAVATQDDLIVAVAMLHQGYSKRVLERNPSATHFKWLLSCLGQFVAGASLLLTIFILIVQSSTVIGMMLNFAALSFIADIDDVAFSLAKNGFVSDTLEREANHVTELKIPSRQKSKLLRRIMFLAVCAGLMAGYGVIIHQQRLGKFLCQSIFLQLGDGFYPVAPFFSGIYDQTDKLINGRVTYIDRHSKKAMLGYCDDDNAWTLTVWDENSEPENIENPCYWFAKSPETETFDITTTSDSSWLVDPDGTRTAPLQAFVLTCADCGSSSSKSGSCGGHGQCVDNKCTCEQGSYGINCEFAEPCTKLAVDARTNVFDFGLSNEYELLLDDSGNLVEVYGRPVYAFPHEGFYWSVLMFSGRRWVAANSFEIIDPPNATRTELIGKLKEFHGFFNPILGWYTSDAMDVGTPTDAFSPEGLGWFRVKDNTVDGSYFNEVDLSQSAGTSLLCAVCDEFDQNCFFSGACIDGVCACIDGYEGVLCEVFTGTGNETATEGA